MAIFPFFPLSLKCISFTVHWENRINFNPFLAYNYSELSISVKYKYKVLQSCTYFEISYWLFYCHCQSATQLIKPPGRLQNETNEENQFISWYFRYMVCVTNLDCKRSSSGRKQRRKTFFKSNVNKR